MQRLLDAKGRGRDMPPPVLISVVESLDALATDVPDAGRKLCEEFWPGPLTVICHAQGSLMWDLGETQGTVALRVPDHENTRELLSRTGPLAVSSANLSGQPAALDVYDAEEQLGDTVAVYLDGGEVTGGQPSTIVDLTGEVPQRRPHRRPHPGPAPRDRPRTSTAKTRPRRSRTSRPRLSRTRSLRPRSLLRTPPRARSTTSPPKLSWTTSRPTTTPPPYLLRTSAPRTRSQLILMLWRPRWTRSLPTLM